MGLIKLQIVLKNLPIIFILLLYSCNRKMENLYGTYESIRYSYLKRPFETFAFRNDGLAVGSRLLVFKDSTFQLTTCSSIIEGNWSTVDDSLLLNIKTHVWRIDSLQENGFNGRHPIVSDIPMGYKITNSELHRTLSYIDSGETRTTHFNLIKTSPNNK